MTGLEKDTAVRVTLKGRRFASGVITEVLPKSYRVRLNNTGEVDRYPAAKVHPVNRRPPTPTLKPGTDLSEVGAQLVIVDHAHTASAERPIIAALPKPSPPARSEVYKEFVRRHPCLNCQAPPPSDPDHNGKRGVGQKCSDFLCVPLCRIDHDTRQRKYRLPMPHRLVPGQAITDDMLRSREVTDQMIEDKQLRLLTAAFARLPAQRRIDVMRAALEATPEEELRRMLL